MPSSLAPAPDVRVGRRGSIQLREENPATSSWKIWTPNENVNAPVKEPEIRYDLKEDALKAAWQLTYGPTANLRIEVTHIEGPNGERIEPEQITAWFEGRWAT